MASSIPNTEDTTTITTATGKRKSVSPEPSSLEKRTKVADSRFKQLLVLHAPVFDRSLPANYGVLAVNRLEQAAKNLQRAVGVVLEGSPDVLELNLLRDAAGVGNGDGEESGGGIRAQVKHNEMLAMMARLKSLYKIGKLPVLDQIVGGKVELSETDVEELRNVKGGDGESAAESITFRLPESKISDIHTTGIDKNLPELPKIKDDQLYERVFTHKSFVKGKSYLSSGEVLQLHNERLEFLGDSILNNLVTLIIFDEFGDADEGEMSRIRALLVSNKTLLKFAYEYGFDKRLRSILNKKAIKLGDQKIYADVFEAYVGALKEERGDDLQEVQDWLRKLFAPLIEELKLESTKESLDTNAKAELYSLIGRTDLHPKYVLLQEGDGYSKKYIVSCRMNDEELGRGSERSIKDAGIRAAMEALKNKEMLGKYFIERQQIERPTREEKMKRELLKKEARLREMEQERENDKNNLPGTPPSPIRTEMFPLDFDPEAPVDHDVKGELYALIGRKTGDRPEYTTYNGNDGTFIAELRVRGVLICTATDQSKKRAMAKAAQTLWSNKAALDQICKDFRTKS
ncbi:Ribonuclease 3 [Candida viswanathii]|uniref:ribonuclease III n=1 Tax=Candida viswanathii TaxID=5486 RepID=A0A367YMW8_9ASCO|nr:Ribonuclease 3 [Candida viswanathii]